MRDLKLFQKKEQIMRGYGLMFFIVGLIMPSFICSQSTNDDLSTFITGPTEIRMRTPTKVGNYALENSDLESLEKLQKLLTEFEELSLHYDAYEANELNLSSEGDRYFSDLFAKVFFSTYEKVTSSGYNEHFVKYNFYFPKIDRGITQAINMPNMEYPVIKDIAFKMIRDDVLTDCDLSMNLSNNQRKRHFYNYIFSEHQEKLQEKLETSMNECEKENIEVLLKIIENQE